LISVYKIKPKFQQLLTPILVQLRKRNVAPNHITWAAILLSVAAGFVFYLYPNGLTFLLIPTVLLIRMALNALDGMMAKTYNLQSKKGEVLNELGDIVSDFFLFFPFLLLPFIHPYVTIAFLMLSIVNEYAGVLAKAVSGERRYDGPMGKSDRALLIGIICLLLYFWSGFEKYVEFIFIVAIGLLILSTYFRISKISSKESTGENKNPIS
jgi:CDP-diacylglycerol---glycerol-3-phosphate 3-phosphatidyltransferase